MNALVQQKFGAMSTKFAGAGGDDELGAGIEASYGVMKFPGKTWKTSYKGQENILMRPDGDGARASIDVVIVKASSVKSKIFYEKGYVEDSHERPDCYSTNGVTPAPDALKKQAQTCALCPQNQWGSRVTDAGKPGKKCSDSKRIAIVPAAADKENPDQLRNEVLGGPMLLRIPAASLSKLAGYGDLLKGAGYKPFGVVTRISFDPAANYPSLLFQPMRPLTDAEAEVILELRDTQQVQRIVSEDAGAQVVEAAAPAPQGIFAAPLPAQAPKAQAPKAQAPVTPQVSAAVQTGLRPANGAAVATSEGAPAVAPISQDDFEAALDALIK